MANLDLAGSMTFESKYHYYIDMLMPHIREVADELISHARMAEILLSYEKQLKARGCTREEIENKLKDVKNKTLTDLVGIAIAYDMGWQKNHRGKGMIRNMGTLFLSDSIQKK